MTSNLKRKNLNFKRNISLWKKPKYGVKIEDNSNSNNHEKDDQHI
jgi:hypothetical protein